MKSYVLVQAVRRVKRKQERGCVHSNITRIEIYDKSNATMEESLRIASDAIDKWQGILGERWQVIAAEVNRESADFVLEELEVNYD